MRDFSCEPHRSLPANPLLADPMYWCGYIEKVGTGTEDIIRKCTEYNLAAPLFEQSEEFRVVLWRPQEGTQESTQESTQETLGKTCILVLEKITANNRISRRQIAEELNISDDTVKKHISKLRQLGYIQHVGPTKNGYWQILKTIKR